MKLFLPIVLMLSMIGCSSITTTTRKFKRIDRKHAKAQKEIKHEPRLKKYDKDGFIKQ